MRGFGALPIGRADDSLPDRVYYSLGNTNQTRLISQIVQRYMQPAVVEPRTTLLTVERLEV
jgi:hypothetical protein